MNGSLVRPGLRLLFGLLASVAIGQQLVIHLQMGFNAVNFFSYFTNLSNLFAAGVLLVCALRPAAAQTGRYDRLRAVSAVNMAVVGIVFAALLRNVDLGALLPWVNFVLHYLMPCVVVLDWLLQPPSTKLGTRQLVLIQVFPLLYLVYVLVRGSSTGWYPYPFVDVSRLDTRMRLFGREHALPIVLAPTAYTGVFHPEGEGAVARGAQPSAHRGSA